MTPNEAPPTPSLEALLLELLHTRKNRREKAYDALVARRDDAVDLEQFDGVLAATQGLRERARGKKAQAIEALGELQEPAAIAAMLEMVRRQGHHPVLMHALCQSLQRLAPQCGEEQKGHITRWLYERLLALPLDDTDLREQIGETLHDLNAHALATRLSLQTLEAIEGVQSMTQAVWLLGRFRVEALIPHATRYIRQSSHRDPLCVASYEALAALPPDGPAALQGLLDEDIAEHVKLGVAVALCQHGDDSGASLLEQELQEHPRRDSAPLFVKGLSHLDTEAYIPLFLGFAQQEGNAYNVRLAALDALGKRKAKDAVEPLQRMLKDASDYYSIHNAVAIALARIEPGQLDPRRDTRLRNLLQLDAEAMQDSSADMTTLIGAFRELALASQGQLEALHEAEHEAWRAYADALRERNQHMLPALLTYQQVVQQAARFTKQRGPHFIERVGHCVTAWKALNESLNQLSQRDGQAIDPEAFSGLRELLTATPSPRQWERICTTLDEWPIGDDLTMAIAYANQHLDAWPDGLRSLPTRWLSQLFSQQHEPRLYIARLLKLHPSLPRGQQNLTMTSLPEDHPFTILDAQQNAFRSPFTEMIGSLPQLGRFLELNMYYNNIGAKGLIHLVDSPHCKQLKKLNIKSNNIGNKGVGLLLQSEGWDQLEELNLASNRISAPGGQGLLSRNPFPALKKLDLSSNNIPDEIIEELQQAPHLQGVTLIV